MLLTDTSWTGRRVPSRSHRGRVRLSRQVCERAQGGVCPRLRAGRGDYEDRPASQAGVEGRTTVQAPAPPLEHPKRELLSSSWVSARIM
jgi:hypothetical protein